MVDTQPSVVVHMRFKAASVFYLLILAACRTGPMATSGQEPAPTYPFPALIACNDSVVGGDALRHLERVEFDLRIVEPGFQVDGTYSADRRGAVRIDIFSEGVRVFSEGWDGTTGWQLHQGEHEPQPTSVEAAAPLRHGWEQPGHLWTLQDMARLGHTVEEDRSVESPDGTRVAHLTLRDGFESWLWIDTSSCLVTRKRDFRAFHPDLDATETWIETRYADFRTLDGVTRPWSAYNIDLSTGDTIGVTTLEAARGFDRS
jgi:hypothetical protein